MISFLIDSFHNFCSLTDDIQAIGLGALLVPEVLSGVISGGGSILSGLLGGIFGKSAQSSANQANLQIARETNELNREMNSQNIQAQKDLFNMAADYNSLSSQVERAKDAGFSPSSILGSAGFNSSMSSPSLPSMAPSVLSSPMIPENAFANSVGNLPSQIADSYLKIANALSAHADVPLKAAQTESTKADVPLKGAQTEQARAAAKRERSTSDLQEFDLMRNEQLFNDVLQQAHLQTIRQAIDVQRAQYDASLSELELQIQQEFAHDNAQEKLNYIREQIRNLNASTDKLVEEGKTQKAVRAELYAQVSNLKVDSRLKGQLYDYLDKVNPYYAEVARKEGEEANTTRYWNRFNLSKVLDNQLDLSTIDVQTRKIAIDKLNEEIEKLRKENKYKEADAIMTIVNKITTSVKNMSPIIESAM